MKKQRTALIGLAHPHAITLYHAVKNQPQAFEIIGFADVPPAESLTYEARRAVLINEGVQEYENWRELLALQPDFAIITADNAACEEVACAFLATGVHVLLEKPMAVTYAAAKRMMNLAAERGVHVLTNWPIAWFPTFRLAKKLLDEGRIGKLMRVTYRSPATWGAFSYDKSGNLPPEEELKKSWWYSAVRGGGSVLDYACYGVMLSTWMFGHAAKRVSGMTKNFCVPFAEVEDYSAMMLDFGEGIGLLEGSWSTFNCGEVPTGPVLYGTEGVIVCDRHMPTLKLYKGKSHGPVPPVEVFEPKPINQAEALGAHLAQVLCENAPPDEMLTPALNVAVTAALEAGARSAKTGITEKTEYAE